MFYILNTYRKFLCYKYQLNKYCKYGIVASESELSTYPTFKKCYKLIVVRFQSKTCISQEKKMSYNFMLLTIKKSDRIKDAARTAEKDEVLSMYGYYCQPANPVYFTEVSIIHNRPKRE